MASVIRNILLWTIGLLPVLSAPAQSPVQYLSGGETHLQNTLQYFEDKTAAIDPQRVVAGAFDSQFTTSASATLNFGVTHSVIWLRFSVKNGTPFPSWIVSFDYPLFDYITLYKSLSDGRWQILRSGDMRRFSTRPLPYRNFVFPLHLADTATTTCYIQLASSGSMQIHMTVEQPASFLEEEAAAEMGHGVFFGALVIMACYNLFLFFGLRDKAYLAYVVFILQNMLLQAAFSGHITQYLLGESPWWANRIIPLLMSASSIVMVLFSTTFLNTKFYATTMHKVLMAIFVCTSANFVLSFFLPLPVCISIAGVFVIISCITVIVAGWQSLRRGNRAARFFLLAWAFLIASGLVAAFRNFGFLAPGFFTNNGVRIASLVEAVLLAMALADRYHLLKKEKEAAQAETLRIQQEANRELEEKVQDRTRLLNQSLEELKNAQGMLVQKEKMASLGELTAGIAHEIQNPLNFVANFAEVSEELVNDLKTEVKDAGALTLVNQLETNLGKISHHGRRAGSIVKGMLLHSRKDIGDKRSVNLNRLADECLNLSYQSFKAKHKAFNVQLVTLFDEPPVIYNCNPQEFDRVLVNLYTNAFYALHKRKEQEGSDFEPKLTVIIRRTKKGIEISVHDNGPGIAAGLQEKIFQPFFTTKPPNQGTGLGLSICYDIVSKGFGGELTVSSKENQYAEFLVRLPL